LETVEKKILIWDRIGSTCSETIMESKTIDLGDLTMQQTLAMKAEEECSLREFQAEVLLKTVTVLNR
jgi:hypothetical protein